MDVINIKLIGFFVVMSMVFITPCLAREISQNEDDALRKYIHEIMNEFAREIQLKHDADISTLKDKFEDEISKLKLEMARKEESYKSKFTMMEAEVKGLQKRVKSSEMPIQNKHMPVEENGEAKLKSEVAGDMSSSKTLITITTEQLPIANYSSTRRTKQEMTYDKDTVQHRRAIGELRVAFFATLTQNTEELGTNQDIVFDNAVTNIGNAYIAHHGTFVAPVSGTYVFSTTLTNMYKKDQWGHFVVDDNIIAKLDLANDNYQSSQTILVHLEQGHDVSIKNASPGSYYVGDRYSSFSGFLLYESDISSSFVG